MSKTNWARLGHGPQKLQFAKFWAWCIWILITSKLMSFHADQHICLSWINIWCGKSLFSKITWFWTQNFAPLNRRRARKLSLLFKIRDWVSMLYWSYLRSGGMLQPFVVEVLVVRNYFKLFVTRSNTRLLLPSSILKVNGCFPTHLLNSVKNSLFSQYRF